MLSIKLRKGIHPRINFDCGTEAILKQNVHVFRNVRIKETNKLPCFGKPDPAYEERPEMRDLIKRGAKKIVYL